GSSQRWPALAHVVQERVADLLRQRQLLLASGFTAHGEQPLGPVNVGKPEPCDFARTQPQPGQQQKHGLVPRPIAVRRTRSNHLLHVISGQKSGNCRELPGSETGNGVLHPRRALLRSAKKPQESTNRDNNGLGTLEPMTTRALQRKAT